MNLNRGRSRFFHNFHRSHACLVSYQAEGSRVQFMVVLVLLNMLLDELRMITLGILFNLFETCVAGG